MSTISPGAATNASMNANAFEANRAQDPQEQGKEKSAIDSSNGTAQMAAHSFEGRVANDPGH
jgi:hypothetical protein